MRISAIAAGSAQQGVLTEAGNVVGHITPGGTVALIILGGLVGTAGGIIYLALRPWIADAGRWRGLAFGALLLAMLGASIIRGRNFDFYLFGPPLLNITTFASLYILFGLLVVPLSLWIERTARALLPISFGLLGLGSLAVRVFGFMFMLGSLLFVAVTILGFGPGGPAVHLLVAYIVFAVPIAQMLIARMIGQFERLADLRGYPVARATAYLVLALPIVIGLVLNTREVVQIFVAAR